MTNLPPSSSDPSSREASRSFDLLDERIQRWIWNQNWNELRDIQEKAIAPILQASADVIIASPTASGKTEAAFLPILTKILRSPSVNSVDVLYISPLKALINDQFERLDFLCEHLEIPVWRWHGDVSSSAKRRLLQHPAGILLITPESLESLLVNHGTRIPFLFSGLAYVVVDELHSFVGTERGKQLQSLLHRIELTLNHRVPRIALSATLGEFSLAQEFLRPLSKPENCLIVRSDESGQEIRIQLRGHLVRAPELPNLKEGSDQEHSAGPNGIAEHIYRNLRSSTNLIFANRRRDVESYADTLRAMCEANAVPNSFWPHHGNLSKELRQDVESLVKQNDRPTNVLCTTTLEMGIDIGVVNSIAQIGPPPSVASLRQRLGRSGRRGQPAILRIYVEEDDITSHTSIQDRLRTNLVQSVAMFELLLNGWYEPPSISKLHLSTFVHQILSVIAQHGGARAADLWRVLCEPAPFTAVHKTMFTDVLRAMAHHRLIIQDSEGLIHLGELGEKIVNHYSFYTVFNTPDEYQLLTQNGELLGTIPIDFPIVAGIFIIFAGRRWEVVEADQEEKTILLKPSKGGNPPQFGGSGKSIHDHVRQRMFDVYSSKAIPPYLDADAQSMLAEARSYFEVCELDHKRIIRSGEDILLFPWKGDKVMNTLAVQLNADGFKVAVEGITLSISKTSQSEVINYLRQLKSSKPRTAIELAATVENKLSEKYDRYLTPELLCADYASGNFAIPEAAKAIEEILSMEV